MSISPSGFICWVDCETTGLDPGVDLLLEVAMVITDATLSHMDYGPNEVVHYDKLPILNKTVDQMHRGSGLLTEIHESTQTLANLDALCANWLYAHDKAGQVPLAGSTVSFDRQFLEAHLPQTADWFHYHNIDVSTLDEIFGRWDPSLLTKIAPSRKAHRALPDIEDSIEKLRSYRYALGLAAKPPGG